MTAIALLVVALAGPQRPSSAPKTVGAIVAKIQHADYAGDLAALRQLHAQLAPFLDNAAIGSRVQYWRGFAMWRRALNAFNNDNADRRAIEQDLNECVASFTDALARDAAFTDAKAGKASCLANLAFLRYTSGTAGSRELLDQSNALIKECVAAAPENPRVLWVVGANQWYAPAGAGGGQPAAIATYKKGLEVARAHGAANGHPLDPAWGEPELLMNLAFASFYGESRDIAAAKRYAEEALTLVPYWHYVRDILLPQIRAQNAKRPITSAARRSVEP